MNKDKRMQLNGRYAVSGEIYVVLTDESPVNAADRTEKPLRFHNKYPAAVAAKNISISNY